MLVRTINIKKYIKPYILSALLLMFHMIQIQAQNVWVNEHLPARNLITEEKLRYDINFLSDSLCQGRATGTRGSSEASFWISRRFEKAGLLKFSGSYCKSFYVSDGITGHNIAGMIQGSARQDKDSYIIVGAHYDHLGVLDGKMYPGADANASGVSAMLSLAEMISEMKKLSRTYESNIIFVAFDAKEHSMAGSQAFWTQIAAGRLRNPVTGRKITPEKIRFMVNIDQIGSTLSPVNSNRKDFLLMLGNDSLNSGQKEMIHICNRFYSINLDLCLSYYGSENFTKVFYRLSDQRAFVDNNIPAVYFTSGITMNTNKTYDRISSLDLEILQKRIFLIYHWIDRMI